jgi:TetR/AcrR family transcriptional regulator
MISTSLSDDDPWVVGSLTRSVPPGVAPFNSNAAALRQHIEEQRAHRGAASKISGNCMFSFSLRLALLPNWSRARKIVNGYLLTNQRPHPMGIATSNRAAPRVRLKTDERQREIVAAVLSLAREHGPDSITTQAIADRIGVTQGALFRHFPDKEAIWLAVFAWVRESLGAVLDAAVAKADSPLGKIEHAFLAHVAFVAANPGVPRVLFHELQYPGDSRVRADVGAMIAAYSKRLALLFAQAKKAGELPAGLDASLAPVLFIGAVQGLVIQSALAGDEAAMIKRARQLFPLLLDGYRGRRKP